MNVLIFANLFERLDLTQPVGVSHYLIVGAVLFVCGALCMATKRNAIGVLMGYDFHLGEDGPKLIEINRHADQRFRRARKRPAAHGSGRQCDQPRAVSPCFGR